MAEFAIRNRPALSADYYKPEPAWVLLCFAYSFALYFGCGYLTYAVTLTSWSLVAKIPAVLVLGLLACNGLHLLGWLSHEGVHLSMVKEKHLNMVLGGFAGSVLLFPAVGLGISHWPHHRFTNDARDPDTVLQSKQQTFWRRLLLARPMANRKYTADAIAVLFNWPRDSTYRLPFTERRLRILSGVGFAFTALWLAFYIGVGIANPRYALTAFLLPYLLLIPVTGLRIYVEHAGTRPGEFVDARSYTSPIYTVLLFGNNYHLEHHLYPSVPSYKLPRVHKKLLAEGYFARFPAPVVKGFFAPLRFTSSRYPYPNAGQTAAPARRAVSGAGDQVADA